MILRIGTYSGYNNNLLIATSDLSLGSNRDTNSTLSVDLSAESIPRQDENVQLDDDRNYIELSDENDIELSDDENVELSDDDSHNEANISLMLGIAFKGGLGALIYEFVIR